MWCDLGTGFLPMQQPVRHTVRTAMLWSIVDRVCHYGLQTLVSILLARLLLPGDIGLVSMIWLFISLGQTLCEGGMGQALLQKKGADIVAESAVFYFNALMAILGAAILWFAAPWIADYFRQEQLVWIVRVLGLGLPISALTLVPVTLMNKRLNFKSQTRISVIEVLVSGTVAVGMALRGYGVWSLVGQSLSQNLVRLVLFFAVGRWRPAWHLDWTELKSLLRFGTGVLASNVVDVVFRNLNPMVIGRLYAAQELGFYTLGSRVPSLFGDNLSAIVSRVVRSYYPQVADDKIKFRQAVRMTILHMMFINIPVMVGLISIADPLVRCVLGSKWVLCIPYLQLYCVFQLLFTLHCGNVDAILGLGRTRLFFELGLLRQILIVTSIVICWRWGVGGLIVGQIAASCISFVVQATYVGRLIGYGMAAQLRDLVPCVLCTGAMAGAMLLCAQLAISSLFLRVGVPLLAGLLVFALLCVAFRIRTYGNIMRSVLPSRAG